MSREHANLSARVVAVKHLFVNWAANRPEKLTNLVQDAELKGFSKDSEWASRELEAYRVGSNGPRKDLSSE